MSPTADSSQGCREIRELVAWFATGTLEEAERRQVEAHLAACSDCAELLGFARDLKQSLAAQETLHPGADLLVRFAEGTSDLSPTERAFVEGHLERCDACKNEVAILDAVDEEAAGSLPARPESLGWRFQRAIHDLLAPLLRPAPAAVYLTVAVVAVALLLARPAWEPEEGPPARGEVTHPGAGARVGGVVLLADGAAAVRGGPEVAAPLPMITSERAAFLILELTDLEEPPQKDAVFRVRIAPEDSPEAMWEESVRGETFEENFTLCLLLGANMLGPGRYRVTVTGPEEETIFRSALEVR